MNQELKWVFYTMAALRISQLFFDYNYDRADQYWQGSQVAYWMRYGYGYMSWEWIMDEPIRSPLYQLYLKLGYVFCDHFHCGTYLKEIICKIMQMFLSLVCDWFLIKIASFYVRKVSYLVCLCLLTNWYYFSMLNRIYINSVETCLFVISFYFWIVREENRLNDYISRLFVMINFCLRPTSLFLWAVIWPYELFTKKEGKILFIFKNGVQIVINCLFSVLVGSWWYGRWIWIDFNFFKYNIFLKFSELYGINTYFDYFLIFIPLIMTSYLLPFFISLKEHFPQLKKSWTKKKEKAESEEEIQGKVEVIEQWQSKKFWELFLLTIAILLVLSLSTHKEPRFLLVLTPILLVLSIKGFQKLQENKLFLFLILLVNFFLFFSMTLFTKTGGTNILRDLRTEIDKYPEQYHKNLTLMYLCEPHSLPLMTVIQRNIKFKVIDTSPFKKLQNFDEYYELNNNPDQLYLEMSSGVDPNFVIIQQKYAAKGPQLNEKYSFLLDKGYEITSVRRNINLLEEYFIGWDGFVLLRKV